MQSRTLLFLIAALFIASCRESPKPEETAEPKAASTPEPREAEGYSGETQTSWEYCFASRTPTPDEFGETYSYQFMRMKVDAEGKASGMMISAPYGTDGARGSIQGVYREEGNKVESTTTYLAEGEIYTEPRDYQLRPERLSTINAAGEAVFAIPAVPCEQYERYFNEYQSGILKRRVNTTDRSRLKNVASVAEFGYTEAQLNEIRFMEIEVDLDNNYESREFLLYIMDPMVCGSGGCNLLVIDSEGNTISKTTVVKLPVYMPTTLSGKGAKGEWKPLYVWSQGFRELKAENGRYPANASMAPEVPEEHLGGYPEKYQLILDYMD